MEMVFYTIKMVINITKVHLQQVHFMDMEQNIMNQPKCLNILDLGIKEKTWEGIDG